MTIYVDCVSGVQHLIDLSTSLSNQNITNQNSTDILNSFKKCYYDGYIISKCGRHIISANTLIENIRKTIDNLPNVKDVNIYSFVNSYYEIFIRDVIEAALKGIYNNCAWPTYGSNSYEPK